MNFIEATNGRDIVVSVYTVESGYIRERLDFFAGKYASQFLDANEFFLAYKRKAVPDDNLDYDEWAFLCDQLLYEQTGSSPPCGSIDSKERPEIDSGLSYWSGEIVQPGNLFRKSAPSSARLRHLCSG